MSISGIGYHYNQNNTTTIKNHKLTTDSYLPKNDIQEQTNPRETIQNTSVQDIYEANKARCSRKEQEGEEEENMQKQADSARQKEKSKEGDSDEKKTDTEIIVKPDGSKIMMTTILVGDMETVMSMEIAKPTNILEGNTSGTIDNPNMMVSDTSTMIEATPDK